jgi:hypothetical protein
MGEPINDNNLSAEVSIGKEEKVIVIGLIYHLGNLNQRVERIGSFMNSLMSAAEADSQGAIFAGKPPS